MSMEWITHRDKKIFYIKYSGMPVAEQLAQIENATRTLVETGKTDNLTLTDITDMIITEEFVNLAKIKGKESAPYTKKAAVVGIEGIRQLLLKAVNTVSGNPRVPFSTIEEAKDWLAD